MIISNGKLLGSLFIQETPSGTVNGSNLNFTLSFTPHSQGAVMVFVDGLLKDQGTEYSLTGVTVAFATAPALGQSIKVWYIKR
jgi:hypothetical protein